MYLTSGSLKSRDEWLVAAFVSLGQDQTNPAGVPMLVGEKNIARTVRGAILQDNNFEFKGRLQHQNTLERLLDVFLVIISRQDYCYFHFHSRCIPCGCGERRLSLSCSHERMAAISVLRQSILDFPPVHDG